MKIPIQNPETLMEELESQQFASLYQFDDAPLIDPAGRYLHRWLYFFAGLAAAAVALGFLVRYPENWTFHLW
ncbi:MAG: hypothetical protein IPL65_22215 [Lewinellaceae bacterium]|nr:hypothetical protein [Lewinellaceae bacterium]